MARSGCIYAPTGAWKTTQIKWLAYYIAQKTGKATALLSTDGGGWAPCQPEIDAGMIRPFYCDPAIAPLPTLRKISQGYWPEDASVPANAVNLIPMNWNEVGAVAFEGWTSAGAVGMRYLPDKGINVGGEDRNKLGGFEQTIQVNGSVKTEAMRSSTRGDYGFIQNFIYGLVMNFNSLPCEYVLHTALESKTEDDDRTTIFGPAIAGKKATAQCGSWVGDLLHGQDYETVEKRQVPDPANPGKKLDTEIRSTTVRYYFKKHADPQTGIFFPAKPRLTPEKMAELEREFPGGYFEPGVDWGLNRYLEVVDRLSAQQGDSLRGWRDKMDARLGRGQNTVAIK